MALNEKCRAQGGPRLVRGPGGRGVPGGPAPAPEAGARRGQRGRPPAGGCLPAARSAQARAHLPEVSLARGGGAPMVVNAPMAGVSLSWLVRRLAPLGYGLLELGSPDAAFARGDVLAALGRRPQDEFAAFSRSWLDTHGFGRRQLRRWLFELGEEEAQAELREHLQGWMRHHLGRELPFDLVYQPVAPDAKTDE
ncbi:unnamed protein product, partial [Prorocentrum cordatum]